MTSTATRITLHLQTLVMLVAGSMLLWLGGIVASAQLGPANPDLIELAQAQGGVRVIVTLDGDFTPDATLEPPAALEQQSRIAATQAAFEAELSQAGANATLTHRYTTVPQVALEGDAAALAVIEALPQVASIVADEQLALFLSSSVAVINGDDVRRQGVNGRGWTVAVLDTGVQNNHPWFLNGTDTRVVTEACFNTTSTVYGSSSRCPGGEARAFGVNAAADNCADCGHGTHVAGIIAGRDPQRVHIGVVPNANIIGVNVFSATADNGVTAWTSDVNAALEYVYGLRGSYQIAAVNLSFGTGAHSDVCDDSPIKPFVDNLRAVGIATVAATGNESSSDQISTPACVSSVIAVGSTTDNDSVSYFTNVNALVDLYAPGSAITSADANATVTTRQGTSMAAPHVAGAWAALKQQSATLDVETGLELLTSTGRILNDRGHAIPRLDVLAAVNAVPSQCPRDHVGIFRLNDANWLLGSPIGEITFQFGDPSDIAFVGDWDGDGVDTPGIRRGLIVQLRNSNSAGEPDTTFNFGTAGDVMIVGDWNGDGTDTLGLYRPTTAEWILRESNEPDAPTITFTFGTPLDGTPIAGDWDGDGIDTVGLYNTTAAPWTLRDRNAADSQDTTFSFGRPAEDRAIIGDWNGDCIDTPGVYRPSANRVYLGNANSSGADTSFLLDEPNSWLVIGAW